MNEWRKYRDIPEAMPLFGIVRRESTMTVDGYRISPCRNGVVGIGSGISCKKKFLYILNMDETHIPPGAICGIRARIPVQSFASVLIILTLWCRAESYPQAMLRNAFPHLVFSAPVGLYAPPDSSDRIFVVTQGGVIYVFPNDPSVTKAKVFLDISDNVVSGGELGLLGLAFHPDYARNGYFFVHYTVSNSVEGYPYAVVVSRFRVSASDPDSAGRSSEVRFLRINEPFANHNGGAIAFGPLDGYLYMGVGDGGSGGDPYGNGQNCTVWLGKILRIDINAPSGGLKYSIPPDNPFANNPDASIKKEIYAYGLRNPWRFSFDHALNTLWVGDVGQDKWEEIDTVVNGGNYGWNITEATHCYSPSTGCNTSGIQMPLLEYSHANNQCSITGGFVYRGSSISALAGYYVYADYCVGRIWAFDTRISPSATNHVLLNSGRSISSFGVDRNQELYVCSYNDGRILKFATLDKPAHDLH